jgi:hypothetical protein
MRNRRLHDALRDFALDAASHLTSELRAGHEIPFDLMEEPRRRDRLGPALYHYTPLTAQFIEGRWPALRGLPAYEPAARALGSGAETYLRVQGLAGNADPEPALRAMLERLYEDATNFEFPEERFERVYVDVERSLYQDTMRAAVIAPLPGLRIESDRVELGDGIALVAGEVYDAPPEAVWGDGGANVLCVMERDVGSGEPLPVDEAHGRFEWLLCALRLFKAGGVTLDPFAWARSDGGAWRSHPLRTAAGHARGAPWALPAAEEDELREFLALLAESRQSGRVAWALERFITGCSRARDLEALSDYLLSIRALLDGSDEAGRAALGRRMAALCADEPQRRALQRRIEIALALEECAMAGGDVHDYVERQGGDTPHALVLDLEQSLRALLRDVVCGFLEADLKGAADDILLASGEPIEIYARDLRGTPAAREARLEAAAAELDEDARVPVGAAPPPPPAPGPTGAALAREAVTAPIAHQVAPPPFEHEAATPAPAPPFPEDEPLRLELRDPDGRDAPWELDSRDSGVTPSADWDFDDDASSYAGPV